jgi:hypothetical protein
VCEYFINTALTSQKRLHELDKEVKDFAPESITDVEYETPDVDALFDFLDTKSSDRDHVHPSTNIYGVSFLSFFKVWYLHYASRIHNKR